MVNAVGCCASGSTVMQPFVPTNVLSSLNLPIGNELGLAVGLSIATTRRTPGGNMTPIPCRRVNCRLVALGCLGEFRAKELPRPDLQAVSSRSQPLPLVPSAEEASGARGGFREIEERLAGWSAPNFRIDPAEATAATMLGQCPARLRRRALLRQKPSQGWLCQGPCRGARVPGAIGRAATATRRGSPPRAILRQAGP